MSDTIELLGKDILDILKKGVNQPLNDKIFNDLAIRGFKLQFDLNEPYRKYCVRKGVTPDNAGSWEKICAVPAGAFKELSLTCFPIDKAVKVFMTGGTSNPEKKGKVYINDIAMKYIDIINTEISKYYVFPDVEKIDLLMIMPPPQAVSTMYMLYGVDVTVKFIGTLNSKYLVGRDGLDVKSFIETLKQAEQTGKPIGIIGPTSAGFGKIFDFCKKEGIRFKLPPKSRVMDAGGYKTGNFRILTKEEFMRLKTEILGIPDEYAINVLGMTEVVSLFFDNVLVNKLKGLNEPRYKSNYPWTRTIAVDPETFERLPKGENGLLRHYDLLNIVTVIAIQTDDIGYEVGNGFEIIGRAQAAEKKGCSLVVGEMIEGGS